jgi:hypothetical protein
MAKVFTWLEVANFIFKAHRENDLVSEKYWIDVMSEIEPDFADTLDLMGI